MSELVNKLRSEFQDHEYRHSYAEECLNTIIATQIKVLREQRELTQSALAEKAGMRQPRLSIMEDANYSSWSISTLKRLAMAFDLALSVKFEAFSDVILDFEELSKESLARPSFKDDPMFRSAKVQTSRVFRKRRITDAQRNALQGTQQTLPFVGEIKAWPQQPSMPTGSEKAINEARTRPLSNAQGESSYAASIGAIG